MRSGNKLSDWINPGSCCYWLSLVLYRKVALWETCACDKCHYVTVAAYSIWCQGWLTYSSQLLNAWKNSKCHITGRRLCVVFEPQKRYLFWLCGVMSVSLLFLCAQLAEDAKTIYLPAMFWSYWSGEVSFVIEESEPSWLSGYSTVKW